MHQSALIEFLNVVPNAALVFGPEQQVLAANSACAALLGAGSAEALHGRSYRHLAHSSHDAPPELHSPPGGHPFTLVLRREDGAPCEVQTSAIEITVEQKPAALLVLHPSFEPPPDPAATEELSELSHTLLRRQAQLTQAAHAFRVGVFEHVLHARQEEPEVTWSGTMREIIGYDSTRDADLEWFLSRVHPEDQPRIRTDVGRAHDPSGEGRVDHEFRWRHPSGEVLRLVVRGTTYFSGADGERRPLRTVGAMMDVTALRSIEAEQRRLTELLEATPDFVAITDMTGAFVYVNRAGREFLGYTPDQDVTTENMAEVHPESLADLMLNVAIPSAIRDGVWRGETEFVRHDGRAIPMSQVLLGPRDSEGSVSFLSTIARDLSRERELEEQFRQAQKMEAVGRLAGSIAHDFNNMISAIMGCADIARDLIEPGHEAQHELADIQYATERAADLTRQLLAFGRKQLLRPRVLDVNVVLAEQEPLVRRLLHENIHLRVLTSKEPARILVDPTQIQQVLLNLVVNARDAMPQGGQLTVEARCVTLTDPDLVTHLELEPGRYCRIGVTDTGHGIESETQAHIFEPFFTTKDPGQGTGLGLSTVFGIMKQSGGSVQVESTVNEGTTFNLYFPCTEARVLTPDRLKRLQVTATGGHVLLVEDDAQLRPIVSRVLRRGGYDVVTARDAEEALSHAARTKRSFDLLLSDVMMPGMNGPELAERLRQQTPGLTVMLMSGYTEDNVIEAGTLDAQMGFIAKPFTPGALLIAIAELLNRR